jgi:hypothetical protein
MRPDADTSHLFGELRDALQGLEATDDAGEARRQAMLDSARSLLGSAAELLRLEEEGMFRFYNADGLAELVLTAGFREAEIHEAFGTPPQAVVIRCIK